MKKIITIAAACMISAAAFGQVKFGVKAGFNTSRLTELNTIGLSQDNATMLFNDKNSSTGFHVGAYANYSFSKTLGAQAELLFSTQGGSSVGLFSPQDGRFEKQTQRLSFINLPLLLDIKPFERPFSVLVGPQLSVCVNRSFSHKEWYGSDVNYNDFDAAIVLGAQYTFFKHLAVGLRYNVGLIPSTQFNYEYFYKPENTDKFQKVASLRQTNNMLQLSVGWTF
ncbi:MAG: PorT family protein [Bacteroidales bacterium]|jgi:hypothetical protein|nr:PorT family protein [Bacteroidales bacterium]